MPGCRQSAFQSLSASACLLLSGIAAAEVPPAIAETMQAACAARGLTLRAPVRVQPMERFKGGYTAGLGSVSWEEKYAETWRSGWCALGIYCAPPNDESTASEEGATPGSPLAGPSGLYDFEKNTLFVRMAGLASSTVAHETVHALQYHNFPELNAAHPWDNRDLAAATAAAIEGDAHVVGTSFDPVSRRYWCSMDPRHIDANFVGWRRWRADSFWAHEGFAHVFGPPRVLQQWLDDGPPGADRLLESPPLSTLAVLQPQRARPVDFMRMPEDLLTAKLGERGCEEGLANTAGVVGIWGLLLRHGDDDATPDQLPEFLDEWHGDRFRHIACPGERDDELAWLTRWRSAAAAQEFAARLGKISGRAALHGRVLSTPLAAVVRGKTVVATTRTLASAIDGLADAETRQFANYREWLASGCFPNDECYEAPRGWRKGLQEPEYACQRTAPQRQPFLDWLQRIRRARQSAPATPAEIDSVLAQSAQLASFCTLNAVRNGDLAQACRAVVAGIAHWSTWQRDPHWRLLPHCGTASELRDWMHTTYHPDIDRPFASASTFADIYGTAVVARTFAGAGTAGLRELLADPPLTTRRYLVPAGGDAVAILRLPDKRLAPFGCSVVSSDVLGARWIWNLLLDFGQLTDDDAPPDWLRHWQGDRHAYVRCATAGEGWVWAIRWQDEAAARTFAAAYAALEDHRDETGLPAQRVEVRGQTTWLLPDAPWLWRIEPTLTDGLEVERFATFQDWKAGGCYPQAECNRVAQQAP